jgi:DNA polymerase III delta subunit
MHFKRKDAFRRQLRNWSAAGLDEVIERLADAQATVRRNPRIAGAALSRALLGIALAAVRRG